MKLRLLLVTLFVFVLTGGALAQENFVSTQRLDAPELAALGEMNIGVQTLELVNPGQLDIVNTEEGGEAPLYDRPLTTEVWYPAATDDFGGEYVVNTRNPEVQATLTGVAVRDAAPDAENGPYPLVIISHGYPGNRFLLSHLAENLATKGYVVISIDHTDSTYADQNVFGSTLYFRPIDQHFVIDEAIRLSGEADNFLSGMIQADNVAIVGYSMGGYGALISVGGSVTDEAVALGYATVNDLLAAHQSDSESYAELLADSPVKAVVAFAPWGRNTGFWDETTLEGVELPVLFIAGSEDDVSGYEIGTRAIWEQTVNADRYLLTYENARHNAGAPIPPPVEVTDFDRYMHYADNVWDSTRMNNISQHFVTAFLGIHLKGEDYNAYLDVVPNAIDAVYAVDEAGEFTEEHNYWPGFQDRTAIGLSLEFLASGE